MSNEREGGQELVPGFIWLTADDAELLIAVDAIESVNRAPSGKGSRVCPKSSSDEPYVVSESLEEVARRIRVADAQTTTTLILSQIADELLHIQLRMAGS